MYLIDMNKPNRTQPLYAHAQRAARALVGDRGATDPILVIAAIAVSLVLLVGGSFAVSGIITNGHDLNARSDLDKVAVAEVSVYAENDGYANYSYLSEVEAGDDIDAAEPGTQFLSKAPVGFTPTATSAGLVAVACDDGWAAISKSVSGKAYLRSSEASTIYRAPATDMPLGGCVTAGMVADLLSDVGGDTAPVAGGPSGDTPALTPSLATDAWSEDPFIKFQKYTTDGNPLPAEPGNAAIVALGGGQNVTLTDVRVFIGTTEVTVTGGTWTILTAGPPTDVFQWTVTTDATLGDGSNSTKRAVFNDGHIEFNVNGAPASIGFDQMGNNSWPTWND